MTTHPIFNKKVKPLITYTVLSLGLFICGLIVHQAFNSRLLFFNKDKDQLNQPIFPTNRQEYREYLLESQPEIIEDIVLGSINGDPSFVKNIDKYDDILKEAAKKYKVDCTLAKATMMAESRGNPQVKSWVGAVGLMQLMPLTAKAMGYANNLNDPRVNIMAGTKYMAHLKEKACHEKPKNEVCDVTIDVKFRLAAYNGGPKCNKPGGGVCSVITAWECRHYEAYGQTRHYVDRVKANYKYLKDNDWGC